MWFWFCLPRPLFDTPTSFVIEDERGELLNASIAADGQWRFPPAEEVPEKFAQCIVAFEDKRFYLHPGVDPLAMARALRQNLSSGQTVSGGSTLSMQVIRLSRRRPRTLSRKLAEVFMALRLEFSYSKKEILALYAANAPFGTNVVGLEAAAWRYFGRSPEQLSWGETAALAVLPNAPSLVHPGRNREQLTRKRDALLDKLARRDVIDSTTAGLAKLESIPGRPRPLPQLAPHLLDRFRKDFRKLDLPAYRTGRPHTKIQTTVRAPLQKNITALLQRHHRRFRANGIHNAAALVLEVESGNTLAYVGNVYEPGNPELESHVDMIPAPRSPGSALKPLLYTAMMSDGALLPHSLLPDVPTQIGGYAPKNFDLGYDGAIPASRALSRSLNVPAVKMLQQYKYQRFHGLLRKLGISTLTQPAGFYGLSLILGGCEVSMWELAGIYASMARTLNHYERYGGKYDPADYHAPGYIKTVPEPEKSSRRQQLQRSSLLDHGSLYFCFQAMQEVMRPGEELLWEQFSSSKRIAWKTGTSFGFRDGWAIGVTPGHVVCVWVGNADGEGRPGLTGINTAAPLLFDIFDLLPPSPRGWFKAPHERLIRTEVCRQSGYRAGPHCTDKPLLFIPVPGIKSPVCPYHHLVHLNTAGTHRVSSACESPENMQHQGWFILPPAMEHYYKRRHQGYRELPPLHPGCRDEPDFARSMELIYPRHRAKIYIPIELGGTQGQVVFSAAHRNRGYKIYWHLDRQFVGTTTDFHQMALQPPPGKHTITLVDEKGGRLTHAFEVLDRDR